MGIKVKKKQASKTVKLFLDFKKALEYILEHVKNTRTCTTCTIFTYGLYVGTKTEGLVTTSSENICGTLLKELTKKGIKTTIFVGDNGNPMLKQRCKEVSDTFGVTCILYKGHHKMLYLDDGWGYLGSANFTGGGIGDFTLAGNLTEIVSLSEYEAVIAHMKRMVNLPCAKSLP